MLLRLAHEEGCDRMALSQDMSALPPASGTALMSSRTSKSSRSSFSASKVNSASSAAPSGSSMVGLRLK